MIFHHGGASEKSALDVAEVLSCQGYRGKAKTRRQISEAHEESAESSMNENIVSWDGPNDPANLLNFSGGKKAGIIGTVGITTLIT